MYERGKEVTLQSSVGLIVKKLQVVSFDSEGLDIYLGTVSCWFSWNLIKYKYINIKI